MNVQAHWRLVLTGDEFGLMEGVSASVIAVDDQDVIVFASPAAREALGWGEALVGQPLLAIIPPRLRARHLAGFHRYVHEGVSRLQGRTVRVPALRADGDEREMDLTIRVFRRPDGTKFAVAALSDPALGTPAADLLRIEDAFQKRLYELV